MELPYAMQFLKIPACFRDIFLCAAMSVDILKHSKQDDVSGGTADHHQR